MKISRSENDRESGFFKTAFFATFHRAPVSRNRAFEREKRDSRNPKSTIHSIRLDSERHLEISETVFAWRGAIFSSRLARKKSDARETFSWGKRDYFAIRKNTKLKKSSELAGSRHDAGAKQRPGDIAPHSSKHTTHHTRPKHQNGLHCLHLHRLGRRPQGVQGPGTSRHARARVLPRFSGPES